MLLTPHFGADYLMSASIEITFYQLSAVAIGILLIAAVGIGIARRRSPSDRLLIAFISSQILNATWEVLAQFLRGAGLFLGGISPGYMISRVAAVLGVMCLVAYQVRKR